MSALTIIVRTNRDPLDLAAGLREAVRGVDPTLALFELGSAEQALVQSMEERRFTLLLLGAFAAVALVLAAVGIYGVVSFAVSERTREMGLRIALGAEPRHVFRMVVRQGLGLSAAAIVTGTLVALLLGRVMERLLFGVEARDPVTFAAVVVILLATAFVASAVFPEDFSFNVSALLLCMVILGGMGNPAGVVLGAVILAGFDSVAAPWITHVMQAVVGTGAHGWWEMFVDFQNYRFLMYGLALVLLMRVRPEGLLPSAERRAELHAAAPASAAAAGEGAPA